PTRRGRPQVAIALNPDAAAVVCLYLSFNSVSAVLVDYRGRVIDSRTTRLSTLTMERTELIAACVGAVREIAVSRPGFMRIVCAVQGITDSRSRRLLWSPITPQRNILFGPA